MAKAMGSVAEPHVLRRVSLLSLPCFAGGHGFFRWETWGVGGGGLEFQCTVSLECLHNISLVVTSKGEHGQDRPSTD